MSEWVKEEEEPVFPNPQDDQEYSLTVNYSITVFLEYKLPSCKDDSFYKKELMQIKKQKTLVIKKPCEKVILVWSCMKSLEQDGLDHHAKGVGSKHKSTL